MARHRSLHREMAAEWLRLAQQLMEEATFSANRSAVKQAKEGQGSASVIARRQQNAIRSRKLTLSRVAAGKGWFVLRPLRQLALAEPEVIDAFHQDFEFG